MSDDLQRARQALVDILALETWHLGTSDGQIQRLRLAVWAFADAMAASAKTIADAFAGTFARSEKQRSVDDDSIRSRLREREMRRWRKNH